MTPLYLVVPLFALAAWLDHGRIRSWPALAFGAAAGAVFAAFHLADRQRLGRSRIGGFPPGRVLVQSVLGTAAFAAAGIAVGLHGGTFLLATAIPFLALSLVGNRSMQWCAWLALVAGLSIETATQLGVVEAWWATVLVSGTAAVLAAMVDHVVRGAIHGVQANRALAELLAHVSTMRDWPTGLAAIGDGLARAMDVPAYAVLQRAGPASPLERVLSWPRADWPTWERLGTLPDRAVRERRPVAGGRLVATPGRAGPGTVVVVTPALSARRLPVDATVSSMVASLLAAMAERTRLISGLVDLAHTDELTGLANRRRLFDGLEQEMARSRRSLRPFSVAMVDLDHFKRYNDTFGHSAGDELLRRFAFRMARRVRAQDLVARYGGEEFCLVLPETEDDGAVALVEKLRASGAGEDGLGRRVTFSAGLATWDGVESAEDLVLRADTGLYRAKAAGRDRVVRGPTSSPVRAMHDILGA